MVHDDKMMMDIMKEIGCGESFHIPMANEENRLLEKEIKELLQKKAMLLATNESLDNELREQKNIITNLSTQEAQNQKLITAYRQQNETEQHMLIAAQRENDSLSRECKTGAMMLGKLIEDHNKSEDELTKNEELINKMRETIEWGEETLLAWNNDLSKRSSDVNILETYNLVDNNKFKELDLRRQHLQQDVIDKESKVEKEVSELLRVERELEQTSKLIRQAQHERNKLLEQWQNATNFLNSNQKDTHNIIKEINKLRAVAREVYDNMNENKRKYQDYLEANEELEFETSKAHKINNDLKLSILNQISENDNVQSEVLATQNTLNTLGNTLANECTKRKHMQNELVKLKIQIQQKEEETVILKENVLKIKNKSMTTEERLNELNKIYEIQKAMVEKLVSEKNKTLNKTFDVKDEMKQLQTKIDLLTNQLEWGRNKQFTLSQEESKTKQLIMEKKEFFYNLSYQLETIRIQIESKGTVDKCDMPKLQEKLQLLKGELSQAKYNKGHLEKQLKSTESESRRITKEIEKTTTELERLRNRVEELNVHNEGGEKQIQSLKGQMNRNHLEFMMANIKLEQMKKLTDNECEKVYSLSQQRQELTEDINKKKIEVSNNYERINVEKKLLLDEKSSMKRKLNALIQYIEQRRNRYQILSATLGSNSADETVDKERGGNNADDDKLSVTISEHRIRMAREKLELQDTGDRLDERVQKLETEVRAMENTLHVMNASNSCYKSGLSSVDPASDEYKEKIELEETYEKLHSMLLQKNKTLKKLEQEIRDLEDQYKASNEELESLIRLRDIKDGEVERAIKEANEQMMKLNRANSRIQFDMKQIDKGCDPDKRSALELIKSDITVRMTRKVNRSVLESLSEMSVRHIEVEPTVKRYLSEKNLELPVLSGLTLNAIKSSCGSSAVSLNSSNNSLNSYQDNDKKVSMVMLEPPTSNKVFTRKPGSSSKHTKKK